MADVARVSAIGPLPYYWPEGTSCGLHSVGIRIPGSLLNSSSNVSSKPLARFCAICREEVGTRHEIELPGVEQ
jgi:hypothetical protein